MRRWPPLGRSERPCASPRRSTGGCWCTRRPCPGRRGCRVRASLAPARSRLPGTRSPMGCAPRGRLGHAGRPGRLRPPIRSGSPTSGPTAPRSNRGTRRETGRGARSTVPVQSVALTSGRGTEVRGPSPGLRPPGSCPGWRPVLNVGLAGGTPCGRRAGRRAARGSSVRPRAASPDSASAPRPSRTWIWPGPAGCPLPSPPRQRPGRSRCHGRVDRRSRRRW